MPTLIAQQPIQAGDVLLLSCISFALTFVGLKICPEDSRFRRLAGGIGVTVFLGTLISSFLSDGNGRFLLSRVIQSGSLGWLAGALLLLVLPAVAALSWPFRSLARLLWSVTKQTTVRGQQNRENSRRLHKRGLVFPLQRHFDSLKGQLPAEYDQAWLDARVEEYLSADVPAREIIRRVTEMIGLLDGLTGKQAPRTVMEVRQAFEATRQDLKSCGMNQVMLEGYLSQLAIREVEVMNEVVAQ